MSGQSKWGVPWHFWSGDTMVLPLASHNTIEIGVTWWFQYHKWHHYTFRPRWYKWGAAWLSWLYDTTGMDISIMWCTQHCQMAPLHSLVQIDQNKVQHDFLDHVPPLGPVSASYEADGPVNNTITFLMAKWSRWGVKWLFWSCNAIDASISVIWCQWNHCIPKVKMIEMGCNMTFLVMPCHLYWCWNHTLQSAFLMSPLHSLTLASYDSTGVGVTWCQWDQYQCHIMPTAS